MRARELAHFRAFGFVVLRGELDARGLRAEVCSALDRGPLIDTGLTRFTYAPLMVRRTPLSLALLDRLAHAAAELVGAPVLPVRAKGVRYRGATGWHTDSTRALVSVGFAAYLDPVRADSGALRVLPASHRPELGREVAALLALDGAPPAIDALPGVALETEPGDVIAFDERLYHASSGGTERLQWRVDYVRAPMTSDDEREVRAYYADVFTPDWDGGYDPDAWPSYDAAWRASDRPTVAALDELGVYARASAQEAFMRTRR